MLILMGYIHLDPSDVEAFVSDVEQISLTTKAEKGCLFYSITLDDRSAGRFLVAERWQDQPSLAAHLEKAETLAFLETWGDRLNSDLRAYDVSGERTPAA
ncbi:antibiotic biosynthesis monooxygenase [Agrobacterium sp. a22-2]|uniref:putative quinol monooxygenase n=1 Tax=Agrobacterium sp. a22-2 TaxID=2283840 RepID=UPI0014485A11|nr:putative quinol monooxygenase [Agrobacterium sp. a22-2]NKN36367.1 antibiotic biosynthesis monooxygenase [Agrobacterium sp. a22-2]